MWVVDAEGMEETRRGTNSTLGGEEVVRRGDDECLSPCPGCVNEHRKDPKHLGRLGSIAGRAKRIAVVVAIAGLGLGMAVVQRTAVVAALAILGSGVVAIRGVLEGSWSLGTCSGLQSHGLAWPGSMA
ncbi:hypothetical protein B0T24DRAFT_92972 [Lasiosphaeria ovina]|uniref:Uncharacterized protein n=1 Tax=Lasiosphaeria ovina TaxID=92902 RepID=A0AAE0NNG1_9PEZI|nr:hypothetical protein B0T24DRAFT_92972 [Lasiosphaeria ovina]